ncbi:MULTISPECIES: hypothetical protein [unclassified Alteromonas]|uniref:hypothetical protein n=1 Tax=unclassified Alteromonas TaxID=2614992 RepID=UPI0005098316|nr:MULTISPECIES: hypothetical protein [unclassified Alteromonas]
MKKNEATPKGDNIKNGNSYVTEIGPRIKSEYTLEMLLKVGPNGITQPEAYSVYRESCLHSTISALQNQHDIKIMRRSDKQSIVHKRQKPFSRYWLPDIVQANRALTLLNFYRKQRNAPSLKLSAIYQPTSKPV